MHNENNILNLNGCFLQIKILVLFRRFSKYIQCFLNAINLYSFSFNAKFLVGIEFLESEKEKNAEFQLSLVKLPIKHSVQSV